MADRRGCPGPARRLQARRLALAAFALALASCAAVPPPPPAGQPPAAPARPAGSALTTERQWLQSWFEGTPVRISQQGGGPVSVEVPREFCFDPGRSDVKPALGAVLDKVAESLRRVPEARLALMAAPADGEVITSVASHRAAALRAYLLRRGAPAGQLGPLRATREPAVQLRLELAAAP